MKKTNLKEAAKKISAVFDEYGLGGSCVIHNGETGLDTLILPKWSLFKHRGLNENADGSGTLAVEIEHDGVSDTDRYNRTGDMLDFIHKKSGKHKTLTASLVKALMDLDADDADDDDVDEEKEEKLGNWT